MKVEEAIRMAIEYENRVVDVYRDAISKTKDEKGRRVFEVLSKEEINHVAYLKNKLEEWTKTGHVTAAGLETAIPPKARIDEGIKTLHKGMAVTDQETELQLLKKALEVEVTTSGFYKKMVAELPSEGQALFARFVQIEEGHQAIVQAEIDSVSGMGFWFDFQEFNLEAG